MANEPTVITLKIQETPLQDKDMRGKTLRELNETRSEDTYYYLNNKSNKESLLYEYTGNSFFDAFYAAYILHGDVMISANDIWLVVNHRFGKEVNEAPEEYRDLFVTHKGKKELIIQFDLSSEDWRNFPSQDNRWDKAMEKFNEMIGEHTKGDISLLMKNDFSSTTMVEQAAANICLMSQMQKYFDYTMMMVGCGIQNVHFVGGVEDFEYLITKIEKLKKEYSLSYSLSKQLEKILDIVHIFVSQMKDPTNVDVGFWNKVFDEDFVYVSSGYGGRSQIPVSAYSGWISSFFGIDYLKKQSVPIFESQAPVKADMQSLNRDNIYLLFKTDMKGIEEIKPNVFRPITNIYVTDDKQKQLAEQRKNKEQELSVKDSFEEVLIQVDSTEEEEEDMSYEL